MKKLTATFLLSSFLLVLSAHGADLSYVIGFSANGASLRVILNGISDAKESIFVVAYYYTSKPATEALLERHISEGLCPL